VRKRRPKRSQRVSTRPKKSGSWSNATHAEKLYFGLHNLISMFVFFTVAWVLDLYQYQTHSLDDIFTVEFIYLVLEIVGYYVIIGLISRAFAYVVLSNYYDRRDKSYDSFISINSGYNSFDFVYLLSTIISSILFVINAIGLLQMLFFRENTLVTLTLSYIILKLIIYIILRAKYGKR